MTNKQQLIEQLDNAYRDYRSAVEGLDERAFETKWLDGLWGAREITAHLTGWHGKLASGLGRMARGERPVPEGEDWSDPQAFNETFAAHAKGKQRDQVLSELADAVESFKTAAENLPDDRFRDGKTANRFFDRAGITHLNEHAAMIRSWRQLGANVTSNAPHSRLNREHLSVAVANKLYEMCVERGYVDNRDWSQAARQALAEERANSRVAAAGLDAAKTTTSPGRMIHQLHKGGRFIMHVKELMTEDVTSIGPDRTIQEAAQRMEQIDSGVLPVCDGTRLIGLVTDRDIAVRGVAEGRNPATARVRDVMSDDVAFCGEEDDVKEAAKIMEERQVRRLPVLDREMHLTGIVSLGDLAVRTGNKKLVGEVLEQVSVPGLGYSHLPR